MQHSMSRAFNAGRNRLLLWQGADAGSVTLCYTPGVLPDEVAFGWTSPRVRRIWMAIFVRRSTSRTISVRTGCCTISRRPAT
jgi:hypothetical protein